MPETAENVLRVLFVEDMPTDVELIQRKLSSSGLAFSLKIEYQRENYLRALDEFKPDIIISDFNMPHFTTMEVLEIKKERCPGIPLIIVTDSLNEETAVECIKNGADDYIVKEHLARLPAAVRMALEKKRLERVERQTQEQIRRTAREWRTTFDAMHEGVALLDTDRNIVRCNTVLREMIGEPWDRVIGQTCCLLVHGNAEPPRECAVLRTMRSLEHETWQTMIGDRWFDCIADPILDEEARLTGIVHTFIDITGRMQAEQQRVDMEVKLRQSQKLESIGTLAGGVAHEINNPINGIMNYAQLILDKLGPGHEVAEFASEIGKESERIATIVKNLLSFARHEKQSHSPARMCDIVESTLSLVRTVMRHDQIIIEVNISEELPKIKCRSQQIQQVIMNLLTNARDVLNEKYPGYDGNKKISITSGVLEKEGREWVRTTVEDKGTGVPEEVIARMFDPFYTTKPREKGTGLGLSISHGIVEEHGGKLSVESKEGEWSRFHMDLPVNNWWNLENAETDKGEMVWHEF